jgi:hypothetical protein
MPEAEQTKVCPLCAETIKAKAKVCPHCRHWQTWWARENPQVWGTIWGVTGLLALLGLGIFWERVFGPKEHFAEYRNEISVIGSQFSQRIANSNLMVAVVGTLTNGSDIGWKDSGVEAQFFDKSGNLIDAITVNADGFHGVSILPHDVAAFKIEGRATHPAGDYETYKVKVRWAKDMDAWLP